MPKIFTASWAATLPVDAVPVGMSRGVPRWREGYRRLRELEPGPWFRSVPPAEYLVRYRDILDRLGSGRRAQSAALLRGHVGHAVLGIGRRLPWRPQMVPSPHRRA